MKNCTILDAKRFKRQKWVDPGLCGLLKVRKGLQVLTSDEVTKEVSFRKQLLDKGLLLVLMGSKEKTQEDNYKIKGLH